MLRRNSTVRSENDPGDINSPASIRPPKVLQVLSRDAARCITPSIEPVIIDLYLGCLLSNRLPELGQKAFTRCVHVASSVLKPNA